MRRKINRVALLFGIAMGGFMNKDEINYFKNLLLQERTRILDLTKNSLQNEELSISSDDLPDESDLAASEMNQNLVFELRERERLLVEKIDQALERIENGTYGICAVTQEPIEVARLKAMPWTPYSLNGAEMLEAKKKRFA